MRYLSIVFILLLGITGCRSDESLTELTSSGKKKNKPDVSKVIAKVDAEDEPECTVEKVTESNEDSVLRGEIDTLNELLAEREATLTSSEVDREKEKEINAQLQTVITELQGKIEAEAASRQAETAALQKQYSELEKEKQDLDNTLRFVRSQRDQFRKDKDYNYNQWKACEAGF